jgi:hypothetical protein
MADAGPWGDHRFTQLWSRPEKIMQTHLTIKSAVPAGMSDGGESSPSSFTLDPFDLYRQVFYSPEAARRRRRRLLGFAVGATFLALIALLIVTAVFGWHFDIVWRYETVGLLGASVGTAELLSRYRDAPGYVLLSAPGMGYVLINALASIAALGIILTFDWKFGARGDAAAATQVLVAGFGAMALFRSSLLTVKAGDSDVGIGPSSVLSIIMAASDRSADRLRAADRAGRVRDIMQDVSFAKAHDSLVDVAVALMQNLNPADVVALRSGVDALSSKSELPDRAKSLLLGLKVTDLVSTEVLDGAKASLGDTILLVPRADDQAAVNEQRHTGDDSADRGHSQPLKAGEDAVPSAPALADPVGARSHANGFASDGLPQTPQTPNSAGG